MFDLECVEYGPRFRMVAPWLSAPDSEKTYCCPRDELALHYLYHYTRHGGSSVTLEEFLHEIRILGTAGYLSMFGADWWIQGLFDRPEDNTHGDEREDQHREKCEKVLSGLAEVLEQAMTWCSGRNA